MHVYLSTKNLDQLLTKILKNQIEMKEEVKKVSEKMTTLDGKVDTLQKTVDETQAGLKVIHEEQAKQIAALKEAQANNADAADFAGLISQAEAIDAKVVNLITDVKSTTETPGTGETGNGEGEIITDPATDETGNEETEG